MVATIAEHVQDFDVNEQDSSGASALALACRLGHLRLLRWLLGYQGLRLNDQDKYGVSALHKAVSFGQTACVEELLRDRRICVDQPCGMPSVPESFHAESGGETPLHLAASHTYTYHHTQHGRIARLLLAAGADPNRKTLRGRTAVRNPVWSALCSPSPSFD